MNGYKKKNNIILETYLYKVMKKINKASSPFMNIYMFKIN